MGFGLDVLLPVPSLKLILVEFVGKALCPQTPLGARNKEQRIRRFKRKFFFNDWFSVNPNTVQPRLWEGEFGFLLGKEALFCAAKRAVVWLEKVSIIKVF
jgi:hypothetical protein